jgi:hypothetical protein
MADLGQHRQVGDRIGGDRIGVRVAVSTAAVATTAAVVNERAGRRCDGLFGDLSSVAPLRFLTIRDHFSRFSCCDGHHVVERRHGSSARPRQHRKRRFYLPSRASQHGSRAPTRSTPRCWQKCCGPAYLGRAGEVRGSFGGVGLRSVARSAEATHATHLARLVTRNRVSGRRAELGSERRPLHVPHR